MCNLQGCVLVDKLFDWTTFRIPTKTNAFVTQQNLIINIVSLTIELGWSDFLNCVQLCFKILSLYR